MCFILSNVSRITVTATLPLTLLLNILVLLQSSNGFLTCSQISPHITLIVKYTLMEFVTFKKLPYDFFTGHKTCARVRNINNLILIFFMNLYELYGVILGDGCIIYRPDIRVYSLEIVGNVTEEMDYYEKLKNFLKN